MLRLISNHVRWHGTRTPPTRDSLLHGTLDLLVLRILALGAHHGHGIAVAIQARSGDTLIVDHGSLYPAIQRLEQRGWIKGDGGTSENNRRARFYTLTTTGRKQLTIEAGRWNRLVDSIARVNGSGRSAGERLMFGRRSQRDFEDEIRTHLEMEADRLRGQGLSPVEAERPPDVALEMSVWRRTGSTTCSASPPCRTLDLHT